VTKSHAINELKLFTIVVDNKVSFKIAVPDRLTPANND